MSKKNKNVKKLAKHPEKKPDKRPIPKWEDIIEEVYGSIQWYATRFILFSVVGIVVGFIAIVYGILAMYFSTPAQSILTFNYSPLQNVSVFLGVFVGVGTIAVSLVLLSWGIFWRKKVDNRSIF